MHEESHNEGCKEHIEIDGRYCCQKINNKTLGYNENEHRPTERAQSHFVKPINNNDNFIDNFIYYDKLIRYSDPYCFHTFCLAEPNSNSVSIIMR